MAPNGRVFPLLLTMFLAIITTSRVLAEELRCEGETERIDVGNVTRDNLHSLAIKTARKTVTFHDKPPYEPLSGVHWQYCGYLPSVQSYLIGKEIVGVFTGVLVSKQTGSVVPAGFAVIFSPSSKSLLAVEQSDGKDGEDWKIETVAGRVLWAGYAGTTVMGKGSYQGIKEVCSQYVNPRWRDESHLVADLVRSDPGPVQGIMIFDVAKRRWDIESGGVDCSAE
jgi:hypothetical protein